MWDEVKGLQNGITGTITSGVVLLEAVVDWNKAYETAVGLALDRNLLPT